METKKATIGCEPHKDNILKISSPIIACIVLVIVFKEVVILVNKALKA